MSRLLLTLGLLLGSFTLLCGPVGAQPVPGQWAQYRGYQASGVADHLATPTRWNVQTKENVLWQTEIPGLAHAAPIVWGDRIYLATVQTKGKAKLDVGNRGIASVDEDEEHEWRLLAVDKTTGKILFNELGHKARPRVKRHLKATHCNSTPATDGKHIVAIFGSEGLFCFDMEGKLLWSKDLGPMDSGFFRVPDAQWGFGSSPVIHDGKAVVLCDVQKGSFLAVFDLADGEEVWRTPRTDVPTWGSPTVIKHGGRTHILVNGWRHTGAYDFATGKEIWKLDGGGDIPVPTPIVAHGNAYLTNAHGRFRPVRAVRLSAMGDITPPNIKDTSEAIAWVHPRKGSYMQTPIVVGDNLYSCDGMGVLACFDAKTGEVRYRERIGGGAAGGFTSSPVSDGKHLYFTNETGKVFVIPAGNKFAVTATNDLADDHMSTPAITNGVLLFRTRHKLIAVGAGDGAGE